MTVDNFVGSLVEMAKAYERMPSVEAELRDAQATIDKAQATIQRLELKLIERSNEIDSLHSRIRELEVSRDEAQFQALEADDRTQRALDFIKATFGNAGALIQALEPPAPPQPQPTTPDVPVQAMPEAPSSKFSDEMKAQAQEHTIPADGGLAAPDVGESASHPTATGQVPTTDTAHNPSAETAIAASTPSPAPEVAASPGEPTTGSADGAATGPTPAGTPDNASADPSPDAPTVDSSAKPVGPYAGKTWSQVRSEQGYAPVHREEWLKGGGTLDNWYA